MSYKTRLKWRGKKHPVYFWAGVKHILKQIALGKTDNTRMPVPVPTYARPSKGKKIERKYDNAALKDLQSLQVSEAGFKNILRVNAFLFNSARNKHLVKKSKGNYVPYPLPKGEYAVGENILMDGNEVTVLEVRGKWARIAPQVARLYEVEIATGKMKPGGLYWRVVPGDTGEIWIDSSLLQERR